MKLSMALAMKLMAFIKSAWLFTPSVSRDREGWLRVCATFTLSAGDHVFKVVYEFDKIGLLIDDQQLRGTCLSVGLRWIDWFMWPSDRAQRRLGRHLLKLFRNDIRNEVSIFRANERLVEHQSRVKLLEEEIKQQQLIAATVEAAEQSI